MAINQYQALAPARLTRMVQDMLVDPRTIDANLLWLNRTVVSQVTERELVARYFDWVRISPLIADNARSTGYKSGRIQTETTELANIKQHIDTDQTEINELSSLPPVEGDPGFFANWMGRNAEKLLTGIRLQWNKMIVGLLRDEYTWRKDGINVNRVSWGMPSDMKTTVSVLWTDHSNATPVDDILAYLLYQKTRYNRIFNRITMSVNIFREIIATTEFQNKAKFFLAPGLGFTNINALGLGAQQTMLENLLSGPGGSGGPVTIEFDESRYDDNDDAGNWTSYRFQPIYEIFFTDTRDYNTTRSWDLGNTIPTESRLAGLVGGVVGGDIPSNTYGPISYAVVPPDLDPPIMAQYGVARSFPRKGLLTGSGKMTVVARTYTDIIPVTQPFAFA
jgi:hypothetical protein